METEAILQSDVLDIIFEHRNKDYGAYPLRKFYNNRLYKALGAVFILVLVLCLISYFQPHKKELLTSIVYDGAGLTPPPKHEPVPEKPKDPLQPQKPMVPKTPVPTHAFTTVQIVPNHIPTTSITTLDSSQIGTHTVKAPGNTVVPVTPKTPEGPGGSGPGTTTTPPVDRITPTDYAEVMPEFPGGPDALRKFLERNLQTPPELEGGQSASVKIRFVVGFDGKLKSFEAAEDAGSVFNNEVIRVLKKMPQWIPGKTRGENVSVYYVLPVKFIATE